MDGPYPQYTAELLRHFADLRDGTHGGAAFRQDKERLFAAAVARLDPHARRPLDEINTDLLLGTGQVTATGVRRGQGGAEAIWALSWPEQRATGVNPIIIRAHYGEHHRVPRTRPPGSASAPGRLVRRALRPIGEAMVAASVGRSAVRLSQPVDRPRRAGYSL